MTMNFIHRAAGLLGLLALCFSPCRAITTGFTNQADYVSALSSGFSSLPMLNFDGLASGTLIPSGAATQGITFTYSLAGGWVMQVGSTFNTTSGNQYLGTTGDDAFLSGDQFTMTFAQPVLAVGLFVISGGNNIAGDYTLSTALGSVASSGSTDSTFGTLGDGGNVYFLGLVESDPTKSFTSATFSSMGGLGVPFNIDDIATAKAKSRNAVPDEASTCAMLLGACAGLIALRRRSA